MLYAFRDSIYELAKKDKRIIIICSDQEIGLEQMKHEMPDQYLMEGIAEANIIGMAAGLAADGFILYIVGHGSFLTRRAYEQIFVDACMQGRPIRIIGIGTGLASAHLGPTHTLTEDISFMRAMPEMAVLAPCDADEIKRLIPQTVNWSKPLYVRLARYGKPIVSSEANGFQIGKAILLKESVVEKEILLISTGSMTNRAVEVAKELELGGKGCSVLHIHTVKPLDVESIIKYSRKAKLVVTIEEHSIIGGLGSACVEALADNLCPSEMPSVCRIGLPDKFIHEYGTQESLMGRYGLNVDQIVEKVIASLKDK